MMNKNYLLLLLLVLTVWSNRIWIPAEHQFWRNNQTWIKVQNNSDKDIKDVSVLVWSQPHELGKIDQGMTQELNTHRRRELSDVVLRFRYGSEVRERYVGTLDNHDQYRMAISVNYAGVVTVQKGTPQETDETKR